MKLPMAPPDPGELIVKLAADPARLVRVLGPGIGVAPGGKYRHWDTLRHLTPPDDISLEEWWFAIRSARRQISAKLPLRDRLGRPFSYCVPDIAQQMLMRIDRNASGQIRAAEEITNPQIRDTYLLKSIMEEAITSSQLEGASTTREVAKDMIQRGRAPETRDERMIANNYQALLFLRRIAGTPLTPGIVLELHRVLTEGALDDTDAVGRFRAAGEEIHVVDQSGNTLHVPPRWDELPGRLQSMCDFANTGEEAGFIHPVVRAIVLHFWLAYDHPFVDGNGRTARALFYWSMAREGYWLAEYVSISRILRAAPGAYGRAFLYTETDENDLTYFLLHQMRVILRAIDQLHAYLARKQQELQETRELVRRSVLLREQLNHRQLGLVRHAMKHPRFRYTTDSHRNAHNVSYATARADLLALAEAGLLEREKGSGRRIVFVSPQDLRQRLARLA